MLEKVIVTLFLIGFVWVVYKFLFRKAEVEFGYTTTFAHNRGITKTYPCAEVTIYNWGSNDLTADGDDAYFGIYGIIKSEHKEVKAILKNLFEEVSCDDDSPTIIMVKQRDVFLGTDKFLNLLGQLDRSLSVI